MRFHEVITKQIEHDSDGLSLAGALTAVVAANVNERGVAESRVSTRQHIVQGTGGKRRSRDDRDGNRKRRHQ
jgi:hypothetical protein